MYGGSYVLLFILSSQLFRKSAETGEGCDRTYNANEAAGSFQSVNYPGQYYNNLDCIIMIHAKPGHVIRIIFTEIGIEYEKTCSYDYLEIRDGDSKASLLLAKFCGSVDAQTFISNGPALWIKFHSDVAFNRKGFSADFKEEGCDRTYNANEAAGSFQSVNYPGEYSNNLDYVTKIYAKPRFVIRISFTQIFIENEAKCSSDYLEIRDGDSEASLLLAKLCGEHERRTFTSTGPALWIKFHSNYAHSSKGFSADFKQLLSEFLDWTYSANETAGSFQSVNYPQEYFNNLDYVTKIYAKTRFVIRISFTQIFIENEENCSNDYLEIRDGDSEDSPFLAKLCGEHEPLTYTSTGPALWIKFHSDYSYTSKGFSADFKQLLSDEDCSWTYYASEAAGSFQSVNYPDKYSNNLDCITKIYAKPFRVIRITITNIDLEWETSCSYDYLEIRDGDLEASPILGKLCGDDQKVFASTGPALWIKFHSDRSTVATGFSADFEEILPNCFTGNGAGYGGTINTDSNGNTCQAWSSQTPNRHNKPFGEPEYGLEENYCRNPDGEPFGPWCYNSESTDPRWSYCTVPSCKDGKV